jgi:two-component system chemotaxis sensor kinase CheA
LLPDVDKTGELRAIASDWEDELLTFSSLVQQVHSETLSLRMLPLSTITGSFLRSVRDLSKELGKEVKFAVSGENIELDREILENLRPLVLHLITNALAHGIESPSERVALGKSPAGLMTLSATLLGEMVRVTVRDDGRGVDTSEIREKAVRMGVMASDAADRMSEEEAVALVLNHGFSTAEVLTEVCGRGVGMDVVNSGVSKLKGYLTLSTIRGKFFEASMTVPVTLSIIESLLVSCCGELFAVPVANVQEIIRVRISDLLHYDDLEWINLNGARVRTVALNDLLGLGGSNNAYRVSMTAMVLRVDDTLLACVIDAVVGETEAVVRPFPRQVDDIGNFLGITILPDGTPSFILNVHKLFSGTSGVFSHSLFGRERPEVEQLPRILVVDDSVTSRSIISTILESRGFRVDTAESGEEAWQILSESIFDLLISDVEMPGMSGYDLLCKVRGDRFLKGLPAILVSSLSSEEDRQRALDSGAMAYMVKGEFDQKLLLKIVAQLFGGVKHGKENSDH